MSRNKAAYPEHGGKIIRFVRKRPLGVYFASSILFAWIINLMIYYSWGDENCTYSHIASYAPALSAMMISALTQNKRIEFKAGKWLLSFFLVMIIAGSVRWISRIWWNHQLDWTVLPLDLLVVSLSAFVIAGAFSGNAGVRSLLRPYLNRRVPLIWLAVAVFLWPAITLAGNFVGGLLGMTVPDMPDRPDVPLYLSIPVSFIWALFFNGALGEEAGWRGFALPRLQQRYSPLVASLILGVFWSAFHWIYYFMNVSGPWYMFWARLGDIPLAILFTWLYNRTKGKSLLPVLLMHASLNAALDYLPRLRLTVYAVLGVVVLVVIFTDRMWRKNENIGFIKENLLEKRAE